MSPMIFTSWWSNVYVPSTRACGGHDPWRCTRKTLALVGSFGAGDRFRTDDLVLGKHTLYQLSYTRSVTQISWKISIKLNQSRLKLRESRC